MNITHKQNDKQLIKKNKYKTIFTFYKRVVL